MNRPTLPTHHRLLLVILVAPLLSWHLGNDRDADLRARIAEVDRALYDGALGPAEAALTDLLKHPVAEPTFWSSIGRLHGRRNRLDQAEAAFRRAAREFETLGEIARAAEARRELGHVLYRQKDFPGAVAALRLSEKSGVAVNRPLLDLLEVFATSRPYELQAGVVETTVPMEIEIVPTIDVFLGDQGPFRFVVDTGAGLSVVASHVAERCGVRTLAEAKAYGAGGSALIPIDLARLEELRIGKIPIRNVPVAVVESRRLEFELRQLDEPLRLDGIIGLPLLREFSQVRLDFATGQLRLSYGPRASLESTGHPISFVKDQLYVEVQTAEEEPLHFFVDTGANVSSITDQGLARITVDPDDLRTSEKSVFGAAGQKQVEQEFSPVELRLGERRFQRPALIVETTDAHQRRRVRRDGVLGSDLMEAACVDFDFDRMSIFWQGELPEAR